ncbi:MAG: lipopolysaccharide biosynthesis protein [Bacteroidota bacterium]
MEGLRQLPGTIVTRLALMGSTLMVVLLNTHYLGTAGQGTASLLALGIMLVVALSNFIGGGALVYIAPRQKEGEALWPGVTWATISALIFLAVFRLVPVVPPELILHACAIGWIQSLAMILQHVTLARERIRMFNLVISLQAMLVALILLACFTVATWASIYAYVLALYISSALALIIYARTLASYIRSAVLAGMYETFRELLRFGKYAQGGNVLHLLNQRLHVVFLENLWMYGRQAAGLYAIALYIAEAIWTVSKSLSTLQYARIANMNDDAHQRGLTARYLRISLGASGLGVLALMLTPSFVYEWIFTREAQELKTILLWLCPGILANGASIIYAHYFSGRGHHRENMMASAWGLVFSVSAALLLVPQHGAAGAAAATSIALVIQCLWFVYRYRRSKSLFQS